MVVWFLDSLFAPRELVFDGKVTPLAGVRLVPLELQRTHFDAAVESFVSTTGVSAMVPAGRSRAAVALEFYAKAASPDAALDATREAAEKLILTLGFRQFGRPDLLGVMVQELATGATYYDWAPDRTHRTIHLPFVREEVEVIFQLDRIHSTPQGPTLARLYAEACGEQDPTLAVVRFWTLLEVIGEQLRGDRKAKARAVLDRAGGPVPKIDGRSLDEVAYDIRNTSMYQGRSPDLRLAAEVREALKDRLYHLLFAIGWAPLPRPARQSQASHPDA